MTTFSIHEDFQRSLINANLLNSTRLGDLSSIQNGNILTWNEVKMEWEYTSNSGNLSIDPIAIGIGAGQTENTGAIAIGTEAGAEYQNSNSIAIGTEAGADHQGTGAIAIGYNAGHLNQAKNSIHINADGSTVTTKENSLYINPINSTGSTGLKDKPLYYNTDTKEIFYYTGP